MKAFSVAIRRITRISREFYHALRVNTSMKDGKIQYSSIITVSISTSEKTNNILLIRLMPG
jgi:hypothetical protein